MSGEKKEENRPGAVALGRFSSLDERCFLGNYYSMLLDNNLTGSAVGIFHDVDTSLGMLQQLT
jgi:hypothetical protein